MLKRSMTLVLSVIITLFFLNPVTLMAADPPPPLANIWLITPKAGHASDFKKGLAEHMAFRTEQGDPRAWEVYTPMLGNDLNRFAIRYCCFDWADEDSYRAWQSGAGEIGEHFDKHVMPYVEKAEHYFESLDWGNSNWVNADEHYKLIAVTEYFVKPGHAMDFDQAKEKMSQVALNHGWATDKRPWLWSSTIGGEAQEAIIIPHLDFASFQRDGESFLAFLSRHMGEEAATALLKTFAGASSRTNFQIWEYQESLSMKPGN